jgi:hypothetical protein
LTRFGRSFAKLIDVCFRNTAQPDGSVASKENVALASTGSTTTPRRGTAGAETGLIMVDPSRATPVSPVAALGRRATIDAVVRPIVVAD